MSNYELYAKIGGDSSNLTRSLGKARKSIGLTSNGLKKMAGVGLAAFKGLSVAAGGAVASLGALTRSGLQFVDEQAKLARALNTTTSSLRGVQIAAEEAGLRDFEMSLERLARRLGAAENGTGEYSKVVEQLNLNLDDLNDMPIDERLATIADAFAASGMSAQEAARAAQTLGFEQAKAVSFFMQGGDAIRQRAKEVREYGNALSDVEATMVERANDALGELKQLFEGIRIELAVQFSGILTEVSNKIIDMGKAAGGFRELARPAVEAIIGAIGVLGDSLIRAYRGFLTLRIALSNVIDDFERFKNVADFLNPFSAVMEMTGGVINKLAGATEGASEETKALLEQLKNAPEPGSFSARLQGIIEKHRELSQASVDARTEMQRMADPMFVNFDSMFESLESRLQNIKTEASGLPSLLRRPDEVPESLQRPSVAPMDYGIGWARTYEKMKEDGKNAFNEIDQFADQAARNMQDAFANFLIDPFKDGLKGMLKSFVQMLNQMVAQIIAKKVLTSFFNALGGMDIPGASMFKEMGASLQGNATGGPMMARQPYMVGEKGPEMVVPSKSSYVVPNNKLGGGGGTSLNVTVNAEDPGAEGRIRTMIERDMAPQIIEAATGRTLNRLRRPQFA